jgi:chromatin segregation and condensation protein Rec8/ScpA/Scc1 (kleisin family)
MARALVLNEVQKQERQERMRAGIMRKLEQNPEMKQAYETLVKNLPEDQREKMMASLAARTMRSIAPRQNQQAPQPGVKV